MFRKKKNKIAQLLELVRRFIVNMNISINLCADDESILSKRSVERLYYPDSESVFRPFVPKYRRRSPLINRGYWLRTKAVDRGVSNFIAGASGKRKVVVNLGCG
jgi:Leucine carboxyl methyltransferase